MSDNQPHPGGAQAFAKAEQGISLYLADLEKSGRLTGEYLANAQKNVPMFLKQWLTSPDLARLSPNMQQGLVDAVEKEQWNELVNAFARKAKFGTGGIRALMAFDRDSIIAMKEQGIDAPFIKGENTINNIVLIRAAYGIGRWFTEHGRDDGGVPRAVVGCDSRIQGMSFARTIAEVLLAEGLEVYLFDEPVPYPEVTFTLPTVKADVGIFISASHNDYRYNGFKMSGPNGAQISLDQRDEIAERIGSASFEDIKLVPLAELQASGSETLKRLHFLGGTEKRTDGEVDYFGCDLMEIHDKYATQMSGFVKRKELIGENSEANDLKVVFAAYNGAGRTTVPGLLGDLGFNKFFSISSLFNINGLFPAFKSDPGEEQQPDPGDPRAAAIALAELRKDRDKTAGYIDWKDADLLIGTDPDADRCGVIAHPPELLAKYITDDHYPRYSKEHVLIPADDMWALIIWYRLMMGEGQSDTDKKYIALSHTTSDSITFLAKKFGLGVLKTWVGFAWLSTGVRATWAGNLPLGICEGHVSEGDEKCNLTYYDTTAMDINRTINVATLEQSNGFSILGGPPPDARSMGAGGHVMDKDGTLAGLLTAEIACYAKQQNTTVLSLLAKHIYADEEIGVFANYYEPDPLDGEYPGLEGDTKKRGILDKAEELYQSADKGDLVIGGRTVTSAKKYWTAKYDSVNGPGFPDEGLRFYFGNLVNHVTIRPSGTTNSLRFHVQLHGGAEADEDTAWRRRLELEAEAKGIIDHIREILGAPRAAGAKY